VVDVIEQMLDRMLVFERPVPPLAEVVAERRIIVAPVRAGDRRCDCRPSGS